MIPLERQKKILELLTENNIVSINSLCELLDVSYMTIKRDIKLLEKQGKVISVSGGVQAPQRLILEPSHLVKGRLYAKEKDSIAKIAATMIPENACIYLDAGTTTLALAKYIIGRNDITVITNDFIIMNYLIEHGHCSLIHTGGTVHKENFSCVGESSASAFQYYIIDIAFISASSWDLRGISTPNEQKVSVKKAAVNSSKRVFLICDASKYGKVATYMALPITTFDAIFTDKNLPINIHQELSKLGIQIYISK